VTSITRRRLLRLGLGAATMPLASLPIEGHASTVKAEDFLGASMRGFSIDTVRSRGNDSRYFDELAKTGANVARVLVLFKVNRRGDGYERTDGDADSLKRILDWAYTRGIRIVVGGGFEGVEAPPFWRDEQLRGSVVETWRWLAKVIGNHPAAAGLDLINEPNPPWPSGNVSDGHALWQPLAERAIGAIRAEGVLVPVIYEGLGGGQAIGFRNLVPFTDSQVIYSLHVYTPHAITHQRVAANWPRVIPYPAGPEWGLSDAVVGAGGWDRHRLEAALRDVIDFQKRTGLPIFVGEFSCVRWAPNGSSIRYISDCLSIFDQYGWSWCYHEFRGWPGWDAEVPSEDERVRERSSTAPAIRALNAALRAR